MFPLEYHTSQSHSKLIDPKPEANIDLANSHSVAAFITEVAVNPEMVRRDVSVQGLGRVCTEPSGAIRIN